MENLVKETWTKPCLIVMPRGDAHLTGSMLMNRWSFPPCRSCPRRGRITD
jgi:hypothetical protein